jgi:hypothetical protein
MTTRARRPTDGTRTDTWELDATQVTPRPGTAPIERSTTSFDPRPPIEQGTPTELTARPERSEPIRMISMKDRATGRPPPSEPRVPLHVQLRSMAEVAGVHEPGCGLGRLAPPRDPRQARARRRRANLAWACVAIALACGITLAIWLVAGR